MALWYPRDSELNLFGYTDAHHAGCTIDHKSNLGGCQFLGNRLISWSSKKQTSVACDNSSAIQITQNPVHHSKTKHIEIRHHFIRDNAEKGKISLYYIPTTEQLADIFTIALDEHTTSYLITELGMLNLE